MGGFLNTNFQAFVHRGNTKNFRENTIEAFQDAKDLGFQYLETDLRETKDKKIITFHDPDFERVCGEKIKVIDIDHTKLNNFNFFKPGYTPTLNELLEEFPDTFFNIDLKVSKIGRKVLKILKDMKAEDRVCIGSFNSKNLDEVHQLNPTILTSMGIRDIVSLKFFKIVNRNSKVIQIPETWKGLKVLSKKFLNKCKSLNLKVHIWTINDEKNMQRLIDLGVDGIMTDKPEVLKTILLKNSISL